MENNVHVSLRALIYLGILLYLLFGVTIITDKIVSCTAVIISHKRVHTISYAPGKTKTVKTRVWHPVVAALTVDTVGTCSPEILLPIIEMIVHGFRSDDLGPSLIVGSGAYHLFIITSICLFSVRESSGKHIKDLQLFFTCSAYALFGYMWTYLAIVQISPDVVEIWEAAVTLMLFPLLVLTCWIIAERLPFRFASWLVNVTKIKPSISPAPSAASSLSTISDSELSYNYQSTEIKLRKMMARKLKSLKKQFPEKSQPELEAIAEEELWDRQPKTAGYYRLEATRSVSGAFRSARRSVRLSIPPKNLNSQTVAFASSSTSCLESCGKVRLTVERKGEGIAEKILTIDYETIPQTAKPNKNYVPRSGSLTFNPGVTEAFIEIEILDDMIYEENAKFFTVVLSKPILSNPVSLLVPRHASRPNSSNDSIKSEPLMVILPCSETSVFILDDDHCGTFSFVAADQAVADNVGTAHIKIIRSIGTKCTVSVPYRITPGSAKLGDDFKVSSVEGNLLFRNGEYEQFIDIEIIDKDRFGEFYNFHIELLTPRRHLDSDDNRPMLGSPKLRNPSFLQVGICENEEIREALDRLLRTPEVPRHVVKSNWHEQIKNSLTLISRENVINKRDKHHFLYLSRAIVLHIIATPWKLLVALTPPSSMLHGYVSYVVLLVLIGIVAGLISDFASLFAWTIGLKESVTAITLVPIVLGLPDTVASRHAAINERFADAAIGGIMATIAVSVSLGFGLSWTIGAAVTASQGYQLPTSANHFSFSVIIFFALSFVGVVILLLRRLPPIRGELGGPAIPKYISAVIFLVLWLAFVSLSNLENYGVIKDFVLQYKNV